MNIKLLKSDIEQLELFKLRFNAWKTRRDLTSDCPEETLTDEYDNQSIHWGIKNDWKIVAGASIHITVDPNNIPCSEQISKYLKGYEAPYHTFRRLVVSADARGKGCANQLDQHRVAHIRETHASGSAMVIISSEFRVDKLIRLGFKQACEIGDFHTFPGGPSTLMIARCTDLISSNVNATERKCHV